MKTKILIILGIFLLLAVIWAEGFGPKSMGYIQINTPGFDTSIDLRSGFWNKKSIRSGDGAVSVPVGTYKPGNILLKANEKRRGWTISCYAGPWGDLDTIKVEKDKTTTLKLGPPFVVKAGVQRRRGVVSIGYTLIGQSGVHWQENTMALGKAPKPPSLKIVDENGKILASGKFEYG